MVVRLADRRSDGRHETVVVKVFFLINDVFGRKHVKSALHLRRDYEPLDNRLSGITRRLVRLTKRGLPLLPHTPLRRCVPVW